MAKKKDSIDHGERKDSSSETEPDFSDPSGYVDDIPDEELLGDILRSKPKETDEVENVIVVDGIPEVGDDRLEKLKAVIRKIYSKFGAILQDEFPIGEDGKSKGYCFIEYSSPHNAIEAVKTTDNYKFDKSHTFVVNSFKDFEKYESIPETWHTPEPTPYKDPGSLWYYLTEPHSYDQYLIVKLGLSKGGMPANDVHVYLNTTPEPTELLSRPGGTDTIAKWSPLGTYMASFHTRGVALWGGEKFEKINRFAHNNVEFIDFSPCERYLVTFSPKAERQYDNPEVIVVWEIRTGAKKRAFSEVHKSPWPILKWSHDDKFFARMSAQDTLSVYETPSFRLLDNKSIKIPDMKDFSWSPSDNIIAYWVSENKERPARVVLLEIPSRREVRAKNLFNVADCRMHWQKSGDYLCVKVDRYSKVIKKDKMSETKYSGMYYNFEIFHMKEKQVPVDSVCEFKEPITAFAWEPIGSKFAIIHGEPNSTAVSFYGVRKGDAPVLLKKFEKKRFNTLFWAPSGQYIVLALLKAPEGPLEFIDTNDFTVMNTLVPEITTDIEWDPTGRYVVAGVSAWTAKVADTGYTLISFQGKVLSKGKVKVERFGNLFWRPRPPSLLSHAQVKEIKKNLKKYSSKFEEEDRFLQSTVSAELLEKRKKIVDAWKEYRQRKEEQFTKERNQRMILRNHVDTDDLDSDRSGMLEEVFEVLIREDVVEE